MKLRWLAWTLFFIAWTALLLVPIPGQEDLPFGEFIASRRVYIAKLAHIVGYAILTILTGGLPLALAWRPLLMFFVMFHAAGSEFTQPYVNRGGSLGDVMFDVLGIALGLGVSWKWWTRPEV